DAAVLDPIRVLAILLATPGPILQSPRRSPAAAPPSLKGARPRRASRSRRGRSRTMRVRLRRETHSELIRPRQERIPLIREVVDLTRCRYGAAEGGVGEHAAHLRRQRVPIVRQ